MKAIMADIARVAGKHELKARVDFKINKAGELVIALLVPETYKDQWRMAWASHIEGSGRGRDKDRR